MIYDPKEFLSVQETLSPVERLEALVSVLRGPLGCPWDQKQDAHSIIDFVIDEAYELKDAMRSGQEKDLASELGDLLFTISFLRSTLPASAKDEAVARVVDKMIARHPHVFHSKHQPGIQEEEVKRRWETFKSEEFARRRLDDDLPASLPPWRKAGKVLHRARNAGFRYIKTSDAWAKVAEEWGELQGALESEDSLACQEELGDLLLALQAASLESGLDAESAIVAAAKRLSSRIEALEDRAGKALAEIPAEGLGRLYRQAHQDVNRAYFLFCGICRWPAQTLAAVNRAAQMLAAEGNAASMRMLEEREGLRGKIGRLVGANSEQIVFVPNVSTAATGVGYCLDWKEGDAVLLGAYEFPANTVPWRLAASTFFLEVHEFDDDLLRTNPELGWQALKDKLEEFRPRLLAISAVSYWSGFRVSIKRLAKLCHSVGTLLFVDGVQAAGAVALDMADGMDFLACGSHKSLLAPEGAGFLVVAEEASSHWMPRLGSWLSLPDPVDFLISGRRDLNPNLKVLPIATPRALEGGSIGSLGYAGLSGSLDYILETGTSNIYAHVQELHDVLEPGLVGLGFKSLRATDPACRSTVLSFDPPAEIDLVALKLALARVGVEVTIPRGRLRFGLHMANRLEEVSYTLRILPQALEVSTFTRQA